MARENINDLIAFLAVARERSFTKAAAQLGVSQSALSHTVRGLEGFGVELARDLVQESRIALLERTTARCGPPVAADEILAVEAAHAAAIVASFCVNRDRGDTA